MARCVKCEVIENRNGYTINKEQDKNYDPIMNIYFGKTTTFYLCNFTLALFIMVCYTVDSSKGNK